MSHKPKTPSSGTPPADRYVSIEQWLRRRRGYTIAVIITVALLTRAWCFLELAASPCFWTHEWDQSDMSTFHNWAETIAAGDWWSRTVRPPLHHWHIQIAGDYAERFPQRWAKLTVALDPDDPNAGARALWDRWCGGGRTYQSPLYPYLIAGTYMLLGPAVGWIYAWQMLLGTASIVLVHVLARRHFGDLAAIVAAALMLLYGPLLFYEFVLLRATLIVFLGLLIVLLLDRASERHTALRWLGVGFPLGLSLALKAHFVFLAIAAMGLVTVGLWTRWDRLARCAGALLVGLAIGFGPFVARNVVAGAPPLEMASNGPVTFLISNAVDSDCVSWNMGHAAEVLAETDNEFLPLVVATLGTHPTVTSYLRLLGAKILATWYWFESPNNTNFYYAQLHSRLLRWLPVSFGMIGPPALVGLILGLRRFRRHAPLYFLLLANLVVLYVFFVFGRFRLPLATALAPFAGFATARLARFVLMHRWKAAVATAVACALPAVYTLSPAFSLGPRTRAADVYVGYLVYYEVQLKSALAHGDLAAAAAILSESLAHQPPEIRMLGATHPAQNKNEARLAGFYAETYQHHARLLQDLGRAAEAEPQLARAAELQAAANAVPEYWKN